MYNFAHAAMAAEFEIHCTHPDEAYARQAARFAFGAVDRLERQLSRFAENSDISRINHLAAGESTRVGYETMQCLQLARLVWAETGGAFDVSIGTGFERLELMAGEFVVRAHADGVRLDLGAIGKGYAVDRVAEALEEWEVTEALIHAGRSSVLALEPPSGRDGWPLTLSMPGGGRGTGTGSGAGSGAVFARMAARQRALGASGIQKGDHILDPRDRTPVQSREAAWVSAPRQVLAGIGRQAGVEGSAAAVADGLSTAFMISPAGEIDKYCQRHPGLEAWILQQGELRHFVAP